MTQIVADKKLFLSVKISVIGVLLKAVILNICLFYLNKKWKFLYY